MMQLATQPSRTGPRLPRWSWRCSGRGKHVI